MPKKEPPTAQAIPTTDPEDSTEPIKTIDRRLAFLTKVTHFGIPLYVLISALAIFFLVISILFFKDLPAPASLTNVPVRQTTKILDRNGKLLYNIYVSENRTIIPLSEIPPNLLKATIAIEDKDFYRHGGINIVGGIFRALRDSIINKRVEGGSTITQQLIKMSLLSPERTVTRKIKEIILAFWTERIYSKNEILAMYINRAPYGGTSYGIEEAAEVYFGKPAKNLSLAECALLAGLPQAPTFYSPFGVDPQRSINRQHQVLNRMVEDGYITKKQAATAKSEKLQFRLIGSTIQAPHFVAYVKDQLVKKYGEKIVEQGGLKVTTTLDLDLQNYAQASLSAEVEDQKNLKVGNAAALVTAPHTGEILAMIGSKDYESSDSGKVNVTLRPRSPGSSIKPLNYALGFLKGNSTPATAWIDAPFCFPAFNGQTYCPRNYDGKFHGIIQTRFALGGSLNIPATKQLALNTLDEFIATASAMGLTTLTDKNRFGYSLTLGGGEVKMIDMTEAFGVFANEGKKVPLISIIRVEDSNGKKLLDNSKILNTKYEIRNTPFDGSAPYIPKNGYILPREVAYLISHILLDDGARAGTFGTGSILNIPGKTVSVKTGTSEDKTDNWAIGYTSGPDSRLVAVWVGNNNNTPMSPYLESGNTGAAPIWHTIMKQTLNGLSAPFPNKPDGVVFQEICSLSGLLPDHDCPKRGEYFIKAFVPKDKDNVWNQKQKVLVFKDSHKVPAPGQHPTPDQLMEEDHMVISDPFQKNYCADCAL